MAKRGIVDALIKKLSTTEAKSLLGVFFLLVVIGFIWIKIEQARERVK